MSVGGKRVRVCYPFVGDSIGGSHMSTLLLVEGLARTRYEPVIVIHEDGPLSEHLKTRGSQYESLTLPVYAGETPSAIAIAAHMLRNLPRLVCFLKRHQIGIVHANDLRMNLTWSAAAKMARRPFVWHQRTLPYSSSALWRSVGLLSDHTIFISDAIARSMPTMGRMATSVIPNPVLPSNTVSSREAAKSAISRELGLDPSTATVGFVGRLVYWKRPDIFVTACARLAALALNVPLAFIMVGHDEGGMVPKLRNLAASMGIEAQVYVAGFRYPIEQWIAGMDVLVATSEREPFGRTLVEAMALGTPVVASRAAGHIEIIDHGRTGLLVSPNDPDAFAAAAYRVLADTALAGRLTEEGRTCALERYSVERHVRRVASIYDGLL